VLKEDESEMRETTSLIGTEVQGRIFTSAEALHKQRGISGAGYALRTRKRCDFHTIPKTGESALSITWLDGGAEQHHRETAVGPRLTVRRGGAL